MITSFIIRNKWPRAEPAEPSPPAATGPPRDAKHSFCVGALVIADLVTDRFRTVLPVQKLRLAVLT